MEEHVKGHQDDTFLGRPFTLMEKLNIAMDALAKQYWHCLIPDKLALTPQAPRHPIFGEGWQLWQGDTKISQPTTNHIYELIQEPITQCWWR